MLAIQPARGDGSLGSQAALYAIAGSRPARLAAARVTSTGKETGKPMPDTIRFFQNTLNIDENLFRMLNPHGGSTLMLAGRHVVLSTLLPDWNYVIVAEELIIPENAATSLTGSAANPSPSVTVLAKAIRGPLAITSAGMPGVNGVHGADGESGVLTPERLKGRAGPGPLLPAGNGEDGGDGGTGSNGGRIAIHYASSTHIITASAPGGRPGMPGKGGAGGPGRPPGRKGRDGSQGKEGLPGTTEIKQVEARRVWDLLDARVFPNRTESRARGTQNWSTAGSNCRQPAPQPGVFPMEVGIQTHKLKSRLHRSRSMQCVRSLRATARD
jgi:hypothetical protein